MVNIYEQIDQNKFKSNIVVIFFMGFIVAAAYVMTIAFGYDISFIGSALIFAGIGSLVSYYYSDRIILSISNARAVTREEFFDFYTVTENLCLAAQMPIPKLYVIDDSALNAFATGRDPKHAVVCATTGLLAKLDRTELEGVIAHELSHIRNYDIRLMSLVTILVGSITMLADWLLRLNLWGAKKRDRDENSQLGSVLMLLGLVLAFLSPIIANLIKLAVSRRREYLADASGVSLTKFPEGLARALEKISSDKEPLEAANKATAHLYISNPLSNLPDGSQADARGWFSNLFSTHPPLENRIAALRSMA